MYRRQTLANAGSNNTEGSAIPMPSSTTRNRQSIRGTATATAGPSGARASTAGAGYAAPATVGRTGSTYAAGSVALGLSGSRGDSGQLRSSYAPSTTVRRSSVYNSAPINNNTAVRRQSTMPGGPPQVAATPGAHRFAPSSRLMKDPRPVKDRTFQKKCRDDILQFLETRGYTQAFSERTLVNPTTKDFQEIFRFIHSAYEGRAVSNLNLAKKFEDEVPQLLRAAGYPFAADISKSHLQAIGAQHSWPGMLAMLHWFVQVINAREQAFLTYPDLHIDPTQLDKPQAMSRVQYRTEMWAEYLSTSYPIFMASPDFDIETQKRKLVDRYEAAGEATKQEIMQATEELERLTAQYEAQCRQGSNIEKAKQEEMRLDVDIHKMEEYLDRLEAGIKKYAVRCDEFRKKISDLEQQEKCAIIEREKVAKIVEQQNLSEVDVHRLTSDRLQLDSKLKTARSEKEEKSKRTYELEVKRSQAFNTIERLVEDYEAKATKLGLIPNPPPGYEHIEFRQELNGAASTPTAMVPDCLTQIKPAISRLRQDAISVRREEEDKVLSVEEELLDLKDRIATRVADCEDAETRYKALMKELTNAKESLNNEMTAAYAELERLQSQCTSIKIELSGGLLAAEQRLQALRNEHDKLMSDVEKLRRDNQEAFAHQLEAIVTYKDYIFMRVNEMAVEVGL